MIRSGADMGSKRGAGTGDIRLDRRANWLFEQIVASGSLVVRDIGETRKGEMAAHRFLSSSKLDVAAVIAPHVARTAVAAKGRRIVAAQDTTEVNFSGREKRRTGLGPAGDGTAKGFFIHPVVAIDAGSEAVLGIAGAEIWTRDDARTPDHKDRALEDKESLRWLTGAETAAANLAGASEIVVVADREGDIYPVFARKPDSVELIIRTNHNRVLADGSPLFGAPLSWTELGRMTVKVAARGPGDKGRTATVALRAGQITLKRPSRAPKSDPATLSITLVEAREIDAPKGVKTPLLWRLSTTLAVVALAEAADVVRLYRMRWRIEEVFRTLKSDGLKLEDSQVTDADRLFKLAALGLVASARIIQLVDARDGSDRPATDVIAASHIEAAAAIGARLEGATARQKNPHAMGSLAWLSWIVARLGGWNCYYKPPGPKTMARGFERLAARIEGFTLAQDRQHV